jgi:non-heme chloroperoxidase
MQGDDNPDGPLTREQAVVMNNQLDEDEDAFYDQFVTQFFSVDGKLLVSDEEREKALAMTRQADHQAALTCMTSWATTDFRDDLPRLTVPTLVMHGDGDGTVPFEGSGCNVSHAAEFNRGLTEFLAG